MNFFIIGVGRSGTSLLQSILSSHSNICIPPETGFARKNILGWKKHREFSINEIESVNEKLKRAISGMSNNIPNSFSDELVFYRSLLETYSENQQKEITGDKDPRLIEFITSVSKLFPQPKFIHLVRDPRDVLLSKKKAQWSKDKPTWYHIFANYIQLKIGEKQGNQISKTNYEVFIYEDILRRPETTISGICEFLGVSFEKTMLSFQKKAEELVAEDEKQWKKETMGPLLKDNTGKWKGELKPWEIALTEKMCEQAFEIGYYEKSGTFRKLSFISKLKVSLLGLLLRGLGSLYIPYRLWSQKILVAWKY